MGQTDWRAGEETVPSRGHSPAGDHRAPCVRAPDTAPGGAESQELRARVSPTGKWGRAQALLQDTAGQCQDLNASGPHRYRWRTQHLPAPRTRSPGPDPASPAEAELASAPPLRPSAPRALAGAPQAQLRRVTRNAQLRRGQAQAAQTDCERAAWRRPGPLRAPRGPSPCRATRN